MTSSSLKEQLQAVASQLSPEKAKKKRPKKASDEKNSKESTHKHQGQAAYRATKPNKHKGQPKPKWLEYAQYGVELLRAYYPNAFPESATPRPLKVGIKQDLVKSLSKQTDVTIEDKACMVKSLAYYVNTLSYLKSIQVGVVRVDLEGADAGEVTKEEAEYSAARHQSRIDAKKGETSTTGSRKNTNATESSSTQ